VGRDRHQRPAQHGRVVGLVIAAPRRVGGGRVAARWRRTAEHRHRRQGLLVDRCAEADHERADAVLAEPFDRLRR